MRAMRFSRDTVDEKIASLRDEAEERDAKRRSEAEEIPYFDKQLLVNKVALIMMSEDNSRSSGAVVIDENKKEITVLIYSLKNTNTKAFLDEIKTKNIPLRVYITTKTNLEKAWTQYKNIKKDVVEDDVLEEVNLGEKKVKKINETINKTSDVEILLKDINKKTPITEVLDKILISALKLKASDIHIEPISKEEAIIRFRIDGILSNATKITGTISSALVSRIKLLAKLKLNIREAPQDGRFTIKREQGDIEVRASVVPSEYGESLVLRVLDPRGAIKDLDSLGLRSDDIEIIKKEIRRPNGMILLTGPTGSGKTTSLYIFLREINTPEIKIITIEDPIEYHLEGIEQTQMNAEAGYSFANGLRSILRQDPDIILVGEIRDKETAEVAIQAALTGHLVFSTLHTNNAAGAIPRLIDLGAKANVIGPAIVLIIAQRLVRLLCINCREEIEIDENTLANIDKFIANLPKRVSHENMKKKIYKATGCEDCSGGYKGRVAITELLKVDENIESLVKEGQTEGVIQKEAIANQGMVLMQQDGIIKILKGLTTIEEIERETGPLSW